MSTTVEPDHTNVPPNPENNRYVLLRSFEARTQHLHALDALAKTLSAESQAVFFPDPLSNEIPSYRANLPRQLEKWVRTRPEVTRISKHRHPSGIDRPEEPPTEWGYVPDRYWVWFRNSAELELNLAELKLVAPDTDLKILNMLPLCAYVATLNADLLEWVKSKDEVINIEPTVIVNRESLIPEAGMAMRRKRQTECYIA
ncbi:hypothetical protein C8J57DRAFT_1485527 [Mycena rebaudengoi]|nr:hypothetical protein C8J57DRAFT_1485527 [Mycena rebaudengoi]